MVIILSHSVLQCISYMKPQKTVMSLLPLPPSAMNTHGIG